MRSSGPLVDATGRDISFQMRCVESYFPSGVADFAAIRRARRFYVDNTAVVREIATLDHAMVLRPPRFGKSLLLSAMKHYYDLNSRDDFDVLFSGLQAAEGEDERRNKYHVLHLDLSLAVDATDDITTMRARLNCKVNQAITRAARLYKLAVSIDNQDCTISLLNFALAVETVDNIDHRRLLVLIDEYDRYANKLMFEHPAAYAKLVRGTSGQPLSSPVRSLFETLKSIEGLVDYRTFTTGITPIALADASGANNIKDLTFAATFADTFGLTEANIVQALNDIGQTDAEAQRHVLALMRSYYNGYTFARATRLVYNTTLCLFFLDKYAFPHFFFFLSFTHCSLCLAGIAATRCSVKWCIAWCPSLLRPIRD